MNNRVGDITCASRDSGWTLPWDFLARGSGPGNLRRRFWIVICILAAVGISVGDSSCAPESTMTLKGSYVITGTMRYLDIEGGCWQFKSMNGTDYEILGSQTDRIQVDGLQARLRVRNSNEGATICMVGTLVELLDIIEIIDN